MISAVSFAVYMRIERQAASNFRHASNSRHLLNTALARAMDEIDSELRITDYDSMNRKYNDGTVPPVKFPTNWEGRVRCSAVADGTQNGNNTRVLTFDSLAYIPAIFVNDVRRFALPNPDDRKNGSGNSRFRDDTTVDQQGDKHFRYLTEENFRGAKWRPILQPLITLDGRDNANTKPQIGRYAYVCVNLSDMLNVNQCRAQLKNCNATTNRLSIGHLFKSEGQKETFDKNLLDKDRYYTSMADFYTCVSKHRDAIFANGQQNGAPFNYWSSRQFVNGSFEDKESPDRYFGIDNSYQRSNDVLVADGIVKVEPRGSTAGNAPVNLKTDSPLQTSGLLTQRVQPNSGQYQQYQLANNFNNLLNQAISSQDKQTWVGGHTTMYGAMIADYLDADSLPRFLCMPSMERTPQINRVYIPGQNIRVNIRYDDDDAGNDQINRTWTITFKAPASGQGLLNFQLCYPFFPDTRDGRSYMAQLTAAFYASVSKNPNFDQASKYPVLVSDMVRDAFVADEKGLCFEMHSKTTLGQWTPMAPGYKSFHPTWDDHPLNGNSSESKIVYTENVPKNQQPNYPVVHVWMVVGGCVYEGNAVNKAKLVDAVPMPDYRIARFDELWSEQNRYAKLCFPANDIVSEPNNLNTDIPISWAVQSLECPDPRFNWRCDNWVAGGSIEDGTVSWNTSIAKGSEVARSANATFAAQLLDDGKGRDGDFIQIGGDRGSDRLLSPGELGFFPRPFKMGMWTGGSGEPQKNNMEDLYNYGDMFRTIRLYDHGTGHRRDNVYRYFYYANEDGTLDGPRVNPLSDQVNVLSTAISATPMDYYWMAQASDIKKQHCIYYEGQTSPLGLSQKDWGKITAGWFSRLQTAKAIRLSRISELNAEIAGTIANTYKYNLSDIYGSASHDLFNWWTNGEAKKLFKGSGDEVELDAALPECYRKMLYSYTLDSFSDRQQLFLYILSAEAVALNSGGDSGSGAKSTASGHAVALVWRDPYPLGYTKKWNGDNIEESWTTPADLYKGDRKTSSEDCLRRYSPWYQYSLQKQRGESTHNASDGNVRDEFGNSSAQRQDNQIVRESRDWQKGGYHEQRVLFFKVLDE